MPIYSTRCLSCDHVHEELYLTFSEAEEREPKLECPKCGSTEKERVIGGTSFQLKGDGWARDNYGGTRGRKKH
jgi:putative FmdB family regulatory protein